MKSTAAAAIMTATCSALLGYEFSQRSINARPEKDCASISEVRKELKLAMAETLGQSSLAAIAHDPSDGSAAKQQTTATRSASSAKAVEPVVSPKYAEAVIRGQELVSAAAQSRVWGEDQALAFREIAQHLNAEQRAHFMSQVFDEMNSGRIKATNPEHPF